MLRLPTLCLASLAFALWAPSSAHAGTFKIEGSTLTYNGDAGVDQISGIETPNFFRFTHFAGSIGPDVGCKVVGTDNDTIDCAKASVTLIVLNLGDGNDIASISAAVKVPVQFNGGPGSDGLFGGGGFDSFNGQEGDDNIVSRDDGNPETVNCGIGNDTAISDDADTRISCEQIEGDADSDGVRRPADCNDTNPAIRPGVVDVPDNGIDEDCSGVDAVNLDRDGDGSPRPLDCDDTNRNVRPGAREVIGNKVDENCDGLIEPFPPLSGTVSGTWTSVGRRTQNLTLIAKGFPAGTQITLRCKGSRRCPSRTTLRRVKSKRKAVNLHVALGTRALEAGARIELRITRAKRVGRVLMYRMSSPGAPDVAFLCAPPGRSAGPC